MFPTALFLHAKTLETEDANGVRKKSAVTRCIEYLSSCVEGHSMAIGSPFGISLWLVAVHTLHGLPACRRIEGAACRLAAEELNEGVPMHLKP